jgi:hypothetical protein
MKLWIILVIVFLLAVPVALAAPAYGTKMPQKGQVFWGLQSYTIKDRDLNKDQGDLQSQQEHILLSYGVMDWLSLDLKWSYGAFKHIDGNGGTINYNQPVWGGGYGFRVRLYENGPVKAVAGFQHISIHPTTEEMNGQKPSAILDDWQGSALISYDLKYFTPYTGVRYGTEDYIHYIDHHDGDRQLTAEGRRTDAVLGVDIPVSKKVWINLEGAAGGVEAVAASLNFHF